MILIVFSASCCIFLLQCLIQPLLVKRYEFKEVGLPIDIKFPMDHVISMEIQVKTCDFVHLIFFFSIHYLASKFDVFAWFQPYFGKIRDLTVSRSHSIMVK